MENKYPDAFYYTKNKNKQGEDDYEIINNRNEETKINDQRPND